MARKGNQSLGVLLSITVSKQSVEALEKLAARGIYGRNTAEVAARFVDSALEKHIEFEPIRVVAKDAEK